MTKGIYDCEIIGQTEIGPGVIRTLLKGVEISREARAGQFLNVQVSRGTDPLLRRPFSVYAAYPEEGIFALLYVVRGRGTELLKKIPAGEKISVVGPLGRGFDLGDSPDARHIVVAGGCGAAPLHFLCDALCEKWNCDNVAVLGGAQRKDAVLCEAEFKAHGVEVGISTDDGSYGYHGLVTQLLEQHLRRPSPSPQPSPARGEGAPTPNPLPPTPIRVYSCGPNAMMQEVARIAKAAGAHCQVSLENNMSCGLGVCMGCVQKIKGRSGVGSNSLPTHGEQWHYERVCTDGPVFNAEDIIWQ